MALASPDLLEQLLPALQDWEWILFHAFHADEHSTANTIYAQELSASRRQANELALLLAQERRATFLRSPAARFVVPAPYSVTYWLQDAKSIRKVHRPKGGLKRLDYVPTRPKFLRRLLGAPSTAELAKARERGEAAATGSKANQLGDYKLVEVPDLPHDELVKYALALAHSTCPH